MRLLVVTAHPDDEAFGMGGTIAKYSPKHDFYLQVMVTQNKRFDLGQHDAGDKIKAIEQSCDVLGIKNYFLQMGYDALMLDKEPIVRIAHTIENTIRKVKPHYVFTHIEDIHQDHAVVSRATSIACRMGSEVKALYKFPVKNSIIVPTNFVPLESEHAERKIEAIEKYWMELDEEWEDTVLNRLEFYGRSVGVAWAEPFIIERKIGL